MFLAELGGRPVGYVAYHHTTRHGTDAELQNIYLLKEAQRRGIGTALLGVVAHRLAADGSQSMCVGYDAGSPYTSFYFNMARSRSGAAPRGRFGTTLVRWRRGCRGPATIS